MSLRISVVAPTYNRAASLRRMLLALARQTVPSEQFEVLVVDDGSSDDTQQVLRELDVPYALNTRRQPNQGPAVARNLGVREARADIVLFLDDDTVPMPDLIEQHLRVHDSDVDAVVIGPMVAPQNWPRPAWIRWEEDILYTQYSAMVAGEFECTPRQFYTANASLRRSGFLATGGFDATFKRAEDVELAYRLRDQGARFVFRPEAIVHHFAERSFDAWCRTPYQYGRYDVVMHREKGHEALPCAAHEFHSRHILTRVLARACVGRPALVRGAVATLRMLTNVADRWGQTGAARVALSGTFNLLYWQGVCDELGGPQPVWQTVADWAVPA